MSAKDTALLADSLPLPQVPRMAQSLEPRRIGAALRAAECGDWVDLIDIAILLEDRDAQWRTVLQSRKLAVVRLPITVEAAADDVRAQKDANLIRTVMAAPGVRRLIYDLMDGIAKGFAVVEVSWSSGSTWLPAKYVYRDQRHFRSRPDDPDALLWRPASANRLAVSAEEPLAPPRMITHRPMLASVPAPQAGLARLGAWLWCFKSFGVQDWLEFLEGFGQPLRVGKYPNSASKDDIAVLRRAVLELGRVAGVTIPAGMELSFEDATGKAADDLHLKAVTYFDQQASKLILGQTTTTDAVSGGHAVSREHNQVRGDIRDADADDLAETLMRDLVQPIIDMNHGPPPDGRYPRLRIAEPDRADIAVMADALDKLVPLGLQVEGSVVADVLGLPDPPPGVAPERLLRPAAPAPALPPRAAQSMLSLFDQAGDRDGIDDLAADALADWRPLMAPMIDSVQRTLDRAATLEEVRDRLAEAIQGMDSDKMADMLARAGFFARAAGELDILPADPGAA